MLLHTYLFIPKGLIPSTVMPVFANGFMSVVSNTFPGTAILLFITCTVFTLTDTDSNVLFNQAVNW